MAFLDFMSKQIEAIEASGMTPEEWIEINAESFRQQNPVDED